ncbi:MAG: alpha/beta hydrolase [Pseudomonadota bacterium]
MPRQDTAATALIALAATAILAFPAAGAEIAPAIKMVPCRLEHPLGLASFAAECGRVSVAENRDKPGRKLALFVARIPALSRKRAEDPLFVLAGGPGLGATTFYAGVAPAFAMVNRNRDIVLIDQRGTGRSHPLNCPFDEQQMWDISDQETARIMGECRDQLAKDHELSQYTTSVAVRDLDEVRAALGYERISLYGSSYGTRVAQHYARRFPARTRALILDGVVPPTQVLGPTTPLDAEGALQHIFARCRADAACTKEFGDPQLDYQQLREKLAASTIPITLADPRSGKPLQLEFSENILAGALRLAEYTADQAALLPLALHMANHDQQFTPLASQFLLTAEQYDDVLSYGMHNSVVCTEDVPFFKESPEERQQLAATFLGVAQLDALRALCMDWPRGPIDADFHAPLASKVPALLMSGTADPVTPESFGDAAAKGFQNAVHLKLKDQGHGQLVQPCVDRVMADFLQQAGGPLHLDTHCVDKLQAPPFFLSLNGPGP